MKKILILLLPLFLGLSSAVMAQEQAEYTRFTITDGTVTPEVRKNIETNLYEMFKAFLLAVDPGPELVLPKKGFTKDAVEDLKSLWDGSPFICEVPYVEEVLINVRGVGLEVRNIPVAMLDYEDPYKQLVVSFDARGNVTGVDFAMETRVFKNLMGDVRGEVAEFGHRQRIVNFLEIFRTAYNKKDIKHLEQMYSDDALIITGRIVREKKQTAGEKAVYQESIEYTRQDKKEYLDKLRRIFDSVKYLDVQFSGIKISRHPKFENLYGVQLRQKWQSSGYSDDGFLFLMIDFANEDNPTIHVRTWQPAYKNGRELPPDDIFNLSSFNIGG